MSPQEVCLKGLSLVSFSVAFAALTILVSSLFSFLVAGSATELVGSMGRTKDHASQMSQGLSYNALLEVIVQLRQQNKELLDRLASLQSVNGSVMAQARHTPATFSDAPSFLFAAGSTWETVKAQARHTPATNSHPSADAAWKARKTKSGLAGWMVCSRRSLIRGKRGDARVALGRWTCCSHDKRRSQPGRKRDLIRSQNISGPVNNVEALLGAAGIRSGDIQVFCTKRTTCGGQHFPCCDQYPHKVLPSRCMEDSHNPTEVSCRILAPERSLVRSPIRRDRCCRSGGQGSEGQLREGSSRKRGVRCLLSTLLCQRRRPRVQGCPTPSQIRPRGGYEEGEGGWSFHPGVVLRGKCLGLRTKECDFESAIGQVYSEEESKRFVGERWEATNLTLSWSKAAVQAFLADWPCTVEASFRARKTRSAIIRSVLPPPRRRLQHDFGCSLTWPAEPRKRQNAQVLVWLKPGKTTAESQKGCEILGESGPKKHHATSDSETSARWKRTDGHDSSRCHHSHPGSRQQPVFHAGLALTKVATVGLLQTPQPPVLADVVA